MAKEFEPIMVTIPLDTIHAIARCIEQFYRPTVVFTDDLEDMRQQAEQKKAMHVAQIKTLLTEAIPDIRIRDIRISI